MYILTILFYLLAYYVLKQNWHGNAPSPLHTCIIIQTLNVNLSHHIYNTTIIFLLSNYTYLYCGVLHLLQFVHIAHLNMTFSDKLQIFLRNGADQLYLKSKKISVRYAWCTMCFFCDYSLVLRAQNALWLFIITCN